MKVLILLVCFCFSGGIFAQSQEQVLVVLEQMKASGKFSAAQIEASKKQLMGMDPESYNNLLKTATEKAHDPAFQKKVKEYVEGNK